MSNQRTVKGKIYLGSPCKRGHVGWRYKGNRTCVECVKARDAQRFWDPAYQRWRYKQCLRRPGFLETKRELWRKWRGNNAAEYRESKRRRRQNNPEKCEIMRATEKAKWWNTLKIIYPESTR